MAKLITVTRKIQLLFNSENESEVKDYYKKLYTWQNIVHKAANQISTTHFALEAIKDMFFLDDGTKKKIADAKKDVDGILTTSKMNSTYQLLSKRFKGEIPMEIITSLNSTIVQTFNAEKKDYFKGTRSLRSYRKDIPIPVRGVGFNNVHSSNRYERDHNYAFTLYGIPFRTNFGRDFSGNKIIFERAMKTELLPDWIFTLESELAAAIATVGAKEKIEITQTYLDADKKQQTKLLVFDVDTLVDDDEVYYQLRFGSEKHKLNFFMFKKEGAENYSIENEYKLCDSSIQIKRNKMFLLAVFQFRKDKYALDKETIAECHLDIDKPMIFSVDGKEIFIGSKEEFLHQRLTIQQAVKRTQIALRFTKGGHGREKKLKNLERFHKAEIDYVTTRIHQYTYKLINLCLKFKVGKLVLKNQTIKEDEAKKDVEYLLRNWSYYSLKEKIMYKAAKVGIEVVVE